MAADVIHSKDYWVNTYIANGYRLFSCNATNKSPKHDGWRATAFDPLLYPDELADFYGVCLQDDDLVLDYDKQRDGGTLDQLFEMLEIPPPQTFMVQTPRGGVHMYLKNPGKTRPRRRVPGFDSIDIKSLGGFVIGCGSATQRTKYSRLAGSLDQIADAPKELLILIEKQQIGLSAAGESLETDDPAAIERYEQYLSTCEPTGTYHKACEGRDYALSEQKVFDCLLAIYNARRDEPHKEKTLREKVAHAFKYAQTAQGSRHPLNDFNGFVESDTAEQERRTGRFTYTRQQELKPTLGNALGLMTLFPESPVHNPVKLNEFSGSIEVQRDLPWETNCQWRDIDTLKLKQHFDQRCQFECTTATVDEAIRVMAFNNRYHPIKQYLESQTWDGVPRINQMFVKYCGAEDSQYTHDAARVMMIGAVARIYQPGCQMDYMVVLEHEQGRYKTSFVRVLGGKWYRPIDPIDPKAKDTVIRMRKGWILEASEMEFLSRHDAVIMKSFLTRNMDEIRLPFDRHSSELPRTSIFIGTINPDSSGRYLSDPTGNRRYLPIKCSGNIDTAALKRDRDQIFAEAYFRYTMGEDWHEVYGMKEQQELRQNQDPWEELIDNFLAEYNADEITTDAIASMALSTNPGRITNPESKRIGAIMRGHGYERKKKRIGAIVKWCWVKNSVDPLAGLIS